MPPIPDILFWPAGRYSFLPIFFSTNILFRAADIVVKPGPMRQNPFPGCSQISSASNKTLRLFGNNRLVFLDLNLVADGTVFKTTTNNFVSKASKTKFEEKTC